MRRLFTTALCIAISGAGILSANAGDKCCQPCKKTCNPVACKDGCVRATPVFLLSYSDALQRAEDADKAEAHNKELLAQIEALKADLVAANTARDSAIARAEKSEAQSKADKAAAQKANAARKQAEEARAVAEAQSKKAQAAEAEATKAREVAQKAQAEADKQRAQAVAASKAAQDSAAKAAAATDAAKQEVAALTNTLAKVRAQLAGSQKAIETKNVEITQLQGKLEEAAKVQAEAAAKDAAADDNADAAADKPAAPATPEPAPAEDK